MKHPTTRELFAYWDRVRGARAAPEHAHIDPTALRNLLGDLCIFDVDAAQRFPFRLAGTRLCDLFGRELRGRSLAELFAESDRRPLRDALTAVVDDAAVAVLGLRGSAELDRSVEIECLLLPLRHRGQTHSRAMGSMALLQRPPWFGGVPLRELSLDMLRLMWPSGRRRNFDRADPQPSAVAVPRARGWLRLLEGGLAGPKG